MTAWTKERCDALAELAAANPSSRVVVIGAVAVSHHLGPGFRTTLDLDLCLASAPGAVHVPHDWTAHRSVVHRWRSPHGLMLDLVAAGETDLARGFVTWPDGTRLELGGIDLALRDAEPIGRGLPGNVLVASLRSLFVCKVMAWIDRRWARRPENRRAPRRFGGRRAPAKRAAEAFLVAAVAPTLNLRLRPRPRWERRKDLGDLAQILDRYVELDDARCFEDPALPQNLELRERPAFLLGLDVASVGSAHHRDALVHFATELADESTPAHVTMASNWLREPNALSSRLAALVRGLSHFP